MPAGGGINMGEVFASIGIRLDDLLKGVQQAKRVLSQTDRDLKQIAGQMGVAFATAGQVAQAGMASAQAEVASAAGQMAESVALAGGAVQTTFASISEAPQQLALPLGKAATAAAQMGESVAVAATAVQTSMAQVNTQAAATPTIWRRIAVGVNAALEAVRGGLLRGSLAVRGWQNSIVQSAQSADKAVRGLGNTIQKVFLGAIVVAAVRRMTAAFDDLARTAFRAQAGMLIFSKQVQKTGQDLGQSISLIQRLSDRLRVPQEVLAQNASELIRYGYSVEQIVRIFEGAVASGLLVGRTTTESINSVTEALISERSVMLNIIGIVENLDAAQRTYAKSVGVARDELTRAQRAEAAYQMIVRATAPEVEELNVLLRGYGGAVAESGMQSYNLRRALGEGVLPMVTQVRQALAELLNTLARLAQTREARQAMESLGRAFRGVIGSIASIVDWMARHRELLMELARVAIPALTIALIGTHAASLVNAFKTLASVINSTIGRYVALIFLTITVAEGVRKVVQAVSEGKGVIEAFSDTWQRMVAMVQGSPLPEFTPAQVPRVPGITPSPAEEAASKLTDTMKRYEAAIAAAAGKLQVAEMEQRDLTDAQDEYNRALQEYLAFLVQIIRGENELYSSTEDRARAADALKSVMGDLRETIEAATDAASKFQETVMGAFEASIRFLRETLGRPLEAQGFEILLDDLAALDETASDAHDTFASFFDTWKERLSDLSRDELDTVRRSLRERMASLATQGRANGFYYATLARLDEAVTSENERRWRAMFDARRLTAEDTQRVLEDLAAGDKERLRILERDFGARMAAQKDATADTDRVLRDLAEREIERQRIADRDFRARMAARGEVTAESARETDRILDRLADQESERQRIAERDFRARMAARVEVTAAATAEVDRLLRQEEERQRLADRDFRARMDARRGVTRETVQWLDEQARKEAALAAAWSRTWRSVAETIGGPVASAVQTFTDAWSEFDVSAKLREALPWLQSLEQALARGGEALGNWLRGAGTAVRTTLERGAEQGGITGTVSRGLLMLGDVATQVAGALGIMLGPLLALAVTLIQASPQFQQLMAALQPIFTQLAALFGMLIQPLIPLVDVLANALGPLFQSLAPLFATLAQLFAAGLNVTLQLLGQAFKILQPVLDAITWFLQNVWIPIFNAIGEAIEWLWNGIAAVVNGIINVIDAIPFVNIKWRLGTIDFEPIDTGTLPEPGTGGTPETGTGNAGTQISQITGPTRDLLVELLRPLRALNELPALFDNLQKVAQRILDALLSVLSGSAEGLALAGGGLEIQEATMTILRAQINVEAVDSLSVAAARSVTIVDKSGKGSLVGLLGLRTVGA